jgi:hypothetical protein
MQQDIKRLKVFAPRLTVSKYPPDFGVKFRAWCQIAPHRSRTLAASLTPMSCIPNYLT